jgi:N-acetylneuraminate synthase
MKAYKIASSDMSHLPLLRRVAQYNKPIMLSTGASTLEEIREAVQTIREYHDDIILLHCTLCYPTKDQDANLAIIQTLKKEFPDLPIGLSDHTLSEETSKYAVSAGAVVLEKHFTVDNSLGDSADHWLSMNPETMKEYVYGAHLAHQLLGSSKKVVFPCEKETRELDKRSIVSVRLIEKGTRITQDMLTYKRPGTGIWPKFINQVIGSVALEDIPEDTTIQWTMLKT